MAWAPSPSGMVTSADATHLRERRERALHLILGGTLYASMPRKGEILEDIK